MNIGNAGYMCVVHFFVVSVLFSSNAGYERRDSGRKRAGDGSKDDFKTHSSLGQSSCAPAGKNHMPCSGKPESTQLCVCVCVCVSVCVFVHIFTCL